MTASGTSKNTYAYHYQVQVQLNVWNIEKSVFVLWNEKDIVVDYIWRDIQCFNKQVQSVKHFYVTGVLPELVGRWLCRKPVESSEGGGVRIPEAVPTVERSDGEGGRVWCYCEKPSYGDMIGCDGKNCKIQWFHMDCLMIRVPPKGNWYCPHYRKKPKNGGKFKSK
ncbi:uncharacterized protein LOC105440512 [Strongylocentrotus purpuratus]|uniref:Zinc finger PHD-type domain-containing protein n=1 Tax=Strongylocentrotus purpuratus TaxID=7668 RepID=A0A7M7HI18_STRPU|nr:uncharacterized protein LOC105440512 [Strongylocentrotus purpuratus]|eukprot:XP_011669066.1 PREDICTED: uncharacterized protein LOC105440512 [Strongylocentrotus purpuratus]